MRNDSHGTNDSELISKIRSGDTAAYEAVFHAYYGSLCTLARHYLSSRDSAEDVVQDVFVRLWGMHERLSITGSLSGYLHSAVRNAALDTIKREKTETSLSGAQTWFNEIDSAQDNSEQERALSRAIAGLPEDIRLVFIFAAEYGMSYPDIAQSLGVSLSTVKRRMAEAITKLRSYLR